MRIDFGKIKQTSWYRQQTASKLYFVLGPGIGAVKQLGGGQEIFFYFKKNLFRGYYSEDRLLKLAARQLGLIKHHPAYLKTVYRKWTRGNKTLLSNLDKIRRLGVSRISDQRLIKLNKRLGRLAEAYWNRPIFLDIFDVHAQKLISDELKKAGVNISANDLDILLRPDKISYLQKYHSSLKLLPKHPSQKDYQKIAHQFFFIKCSYAQGHGLTQADIIRDSAHLKLAHHKYVSKNLLYQKYRLAGWPRRLLESFAFLSQWREERKMLLQKTVFGLNILGQEIAKRSRLPWTEVAMCLPHAIGKIPVPKGLINRYQKLCQRNFLAIYDQKRRKVKFLNPASCKKIIALLERDQTQNELLGQGACRGKVTGIAKVIAGEADFDKFKPGDILITSMTRPEFLPILRQARGIVTDEGGITCHAAIVSRELKIPCVIGTRRATGLIKSGDKIILNANNGTIKIIK